MDKFVKNILIGRTFRWWDGEKGCKYIILNVRKSFYFTHYLSKGRFTPDNNYYEILVGRVSKNSREITVMSWYRYDPKIAFIKRNGDVYSRRKCVLNHPDKYHYHKGERFDLTRKNISIYIRTNKGLFDYKLINYDELMKLSEKQFV